ncbi:MAG TPA: CopD family protein [Chloroflexota bacterium]|nr:CopD family protein [Chloroflexota bacterium]
MSETVLSILLFIHLSCIAVWIGAQVLTAAAVVPSIRRVEEGAVRIAALETFTQRFNIVAWSSMAGIVITGGLMISERLDQAKAIFGDSIFDSRWGWIFVIKMTLWLLMIGAVGLHAFVVGPKQLDLNREALNHDESWAETNLKPFQRRSILLSVVGLILSLLVLGSGAFLGNHHFSFQFS